VGCFEKSLIELNRIPNDDGDTESSKSESMIPTWCESFIFRIPDFASVKELRERKRLHQHHNPE